MDKASKLTQQAGDAAYQAGDAAYQAGDAASGAIVRNAGGVGVNMLNGILQALLPLARPSLGIILAKMAASEKGIPVMPPAPSKEKAAALKAKGEEPEKSLYSLRVFRRGVGESGTHVAGSKVIKTLALKLKKSGSSSADDAADDATTGVSSEEMPAEFAALDPNRVVTADVDLDVKIALSDEDYAFSLQGEQPWLPTLATFVLRSFSVVGKARLWYDATGNKLLLAFLKESKPQVAWEIDLQLLCCKLPDSFEDSLAPAIVTAFLGQFTAAKPLVIDLNAAKARMESEVAGQVEAEKMSA